MGDSDSDSDGGFNTSDLQGTLSKWTNYIHGWQTRFIVLKNGTLSYYKSEEDSGFGCRGAISLHKAVIKPHELDECRFDISVNDCTWYLRSDSALEKTHWVSALDGFKVDASDTSLQRYGSSGSLQSNTLSGTSGSSFRSRALKEKYNEIETYEGILSGQVDTLQRFFDLCADNDFQNKNSKVLPNNIDFRGEAITFRATTSAVLATMRNCLDLFHQREDMWRNKLQKEIDKRRKVDELYRIVKHELANEKRPHFQGGPDLEEGPHSKLKEEEFYDAVETSLDKIEEEEQLRERLKTQVSVGSLSKHALGPEVERVTVEQLRYALQEAGMGSQWHLFAEEGEMKLYKREDIVDGLVMDPLKAIHSVRGVTGHEMCHYFYDPSVRMEWDTTLESTNVVEKIDENTVVFYQVHKRIWPASTRDAVFWSHIKTVSNPSDPEGQDMWTVTNQSVDLPEFPKNQGKIIRIFLTVCLVCQTFVDPPKAGHQITRDDLRCKITYCSVINPGGWAPAAALRQVYKREYPKFVKRFTAYVVDQCRNKPIMF